MNKPDRFGFQQVPDIQENYDDPITFKTEIITETECERQKAKEYLLKNNEKEFYSAIANQELKQFLLELKVELEFTQRLDPSIKLESICLEILEDITKTKLFPETIHLVIIPIDPELQPVASINDLFSQPYSSPSYLKIQCTVMEQSQKSYHVLSKVFKCCSKNCSDQSSIYKVFRIPNGDSYKSHESQAISLFKRSSHTGNLLNLRHREELGKVDMQCFACGSLLVEQFQDCLTIGKHVFQVLLKDSRVLSTVIFYTNRELDLQVGDEKFLIVKPLSKYKYEKTCSLSPIVKGILVCDKVSEIIHNSEENLFAFREHFLNLPPFQCSQELASIFGSGMIDCAVWRKLRLVILLCLSNLYHDPIHILLVTDGYNPLLTRFLNMLMTLGNTSLKTWNPNFYPQVNQSKISMHQNSTKNQFVLLPLDLDVVPRRQLDLARWTLPSFQSFKNGSLKFDWNCSILAMTEYSLPKDPRYMIIIEARFKKHIKAHQENVSHFDLVLNLKSQNGSEGIDESQSYFVLLHDPILNHRQFFQDWFRPISPSFPSAIQTLISAYITSLRGKCDIPYSIDKLVSVIRKLSLAHARLTRSEEVREEDCIVAINLVEESLAFGYDTCLFGYQSFDQDLENIQLGSGSVVQNGVRGLEELLVRVKGLIE